MTGQIPRELKAVKKWLVWKHEKGENGGRLLKVPYNARTGRKAKTNDPKTWSTFKEAAEAYEKSNGIYAGLGFVFTSGGNFTGIDLDECLTDGKPSKEALQILQMVNSYAEISPSGNGLHIIVKGKLEGGARSATCKCKRGMKQIEIYSAGRFFTMTGSVLEGYEKIRDAGAGFFRLVDRMSSPRQIEEAPEEESAARFNDSILLKNELLQAIPCAEVSYSEWLKIGMVCKLAGLSCEDWDEWSASDPARYHEGECAAKWDGFSATDEGRKVDVGTVVDIAKRHGWKPTAAENADAPKRKIPALESCSMRELMGKDLLPVRWIVSDMIPQGLTLLASPPKFGKSWLVLDLCLSVASGKPFMGRETVKGGTLYLALEDSENRLQDRMKKLAAGDPVPAGFRYAINAANMDDGLTTQIEEHLRKYPDCSLIVVDTLQKISGEKKGSESVYAYDYRRMSILKRIADRHDIAVLVVHHLRKGMYDGDPFERISGTAGVFGSADTAIVMQRKKRDEAATEFYITGRDVSSDDMMAEFDSESFRWVFKGELTAARYEADPIVQTVRHILEEEDEWKGTALELLKACEVFTEKPIEEDIGQFGKHIRAVARQMYEREKVLYSPPGKNGGKAGRQHIFRKDTEEDESIFG